MKYRCSPYEFSTGFTPLMHAIMCKNINALKNIIKNNPEELNKQNDKGWTPLMLATRNCRYNSSEEVVKLLIDAGADLELRNKDGFTALMMAIENSNEYSSEGAVRLLINAGCNLNLQNKFGYSALILAICPGTNSTVGTIKMLIDAKCDLNLQDNEGETALMLAVRNSYERIIKMLIDAGCNLDLQNRNGDTALMIAACNTKSMLIMKMLIDAGCDVNLKNKQSNANVLSTVVHIPNYPSDIMKMLIRAGCIIEIHNMSEPKKNLLISLAHEINENRVTAHKSTTKTTLKIRRLNRVIRKKNKQLASLRKVLQKNNN